MKAIEPDGLLAWANDLGYQQSIDVEQIQSLCSGHIGSLLSILTTQSHLGSIAKRIRSSVQDTIARDPKRATSASSSSVHTKLVKIEDAISEAAMRHHSLITKCTALQQQLEQRADETATLESELTTNNIRHRLVELQKDELQPHSSLFQAYASELNQKPPITVIPEQYEDAIDQITASVLALMQGCRESDDPHLQTLVLGLQDFPFTMRICAHKTKNAISVLQQIKQLRFEESPRLSSALNTVRRKHVQLLQDIQQKEETVQMLAKRVSDALSKMDASSRPAIMARAEKRGYTAALHHVRMRMQDLQRQINQQEAIIDKEESLDRDIESLRAEAQTFLILRAKLLRSIVQQQHALQDNVHQKILLLATELKNLPAQYFHILDQEKSMTYDHYLPALRKSIIRQQTLHFTKRDSWKRLLNTLDLPLSTSPELIHKVIIDTQVQDFDIQNAIKDLHHAASDLNDKDFASLSELLKETPFEKCSSTPNGLHTVAEIIATKQRQHTDWAISDVQQREIQVARIHQTLAEINSHATEERLKLFSSIGGDIRIKQQTYLEAYKHAMQ